MTATRGRLTFVAPNLRPPGGGRAVAAWMLQALCSEWDVTVLCWEEPDVAALDRHFGTRLREARFTLMRAPWHVRMLGRLDSDPWSIQPAAYLMRMCRRLRTRVDVFVGAENEMDFGVPGVQYIHFPYLARHTDAVDAVRKASFAGRVRAALSGRYRPWMWISELSFEGVRSNLTLVNSEWSRRLVGDVHGVDSRTVYPPTLWRRPVASWSDRTDTFVSLGRIEPIKRQVAAIEILERVRRRGFDVRLRIVGDVACPEYAQQLHRRARAAGAWVQIEHGLARDLLEARVGECRYGLHTMREEHFGIAVAEMVRAGCIAFVPDGGGQVEIVQRQAGLVHSSDEQAVEQICSVLGDAPEQARLRSALARCGERFSEQAFMKRIRHEVAAFARRRSA